MVSNLLILVHGSRSYTATTEPPAARTIRDARFSHSRTVVASLLALGLVPLGFNEVRHHLSSVLRHHLHYLGDGFCSSRHNDPAPNSAGSTSQNVALHESIAPFSQVANFRCRRFSGEQRGILLPSEYGAVRRTPRRLSRPERIAA